MFAAEVLGDEGLLAEVEACPAPISRQIERLAGRLQAQWGDCFTLALAELEDLDDTERHAVIDAVVAGEESPFVVVDGQVVCKGGIDAEAVAASFPGHAGRSPQSADSSERPSTAGARP